MKIIDDRNYYIIPKNYNFRDGDENILKSIEKDLIKTNNSLKIVLDNIDQGKEKVFGIDSKNNKIFGRKRGGK